MKPMVWMAAALCASVSSLALAQSSSIKIIRYDANGRPQVQQETQAKSEVTPNGSRLFMTNVKLNTAGRAVAAQHTTVTSMQPSPDTVRSETTTQVRDANGNTKTKSKAIMTETKVNSDTTQTETLFQEARAMSAELNTVARLREVKKETTDGEKYQRVIETKMADGDFRPKQKVEAETRRFSDGSLRTRSVESAFDLYGNARPTWETQEHQSSDSFGKEYVERIIRKFSADGDTKLDRVEVEERNPKATTGVLKEKIVKQADPAYGLRETQRVTTTLETQYGSAPRKITVTRESPRNDRFGAPVITQVETEKTVQNGDGTQRVEKELKVRDVNGNLATVSVTQTETKKE